MGARNNIIVQAFFGLGVSLFLSSCASVNPHNVDVQLPESKPEAKITSYTKALSDLGLMTNIFDPGEVKIQSQDIADETGAAATTGAEIQRNVTEIMKSTLNSIGGQVTFIEYNPSFIQNQMVTGYSDFEYKTIPDVVVTGGITEFDRGLETYGEGTDMDIEKQATGLPKWVPGDTVGVGFSDTAKDGKARITLDFNLKDFQSLAGIPKMTTTNSMEVYKGMHEKELGITLFGPTFGLKGSAKKVQGRHEAVRLLVQLSMIQMVGKYLALPYWRLLGEDAKPDPVVMDAIRTTYYNMAEAQQLMAVQQWLVLHGYDVELTGKLDSATQKALAEYDPSFSRNSSTVSEALFSKIYMNIPVDHATLARRKLLNNMLMELYSEPEPEPQQVVQEVVQEVQQPVAAEPQVQQEVVAAAPPPQPKATVTSPQRDKVEEVKEKQAAPKKSSFGRKLSDDEW